MTGRPDRSHPLTNCKEVAEVFGENLDDYFSELLGSEPRAYREISEVSGWSQSHMISGRTDGRAIPAGLTLHRSKILRAKVRLLTVL